MSTEIARRDQDAFELGKVFKASGMFPTMKHEAEAVVKIIAGREFGLGPLASMNGIHMVDGKPTLAANLIAGQIKRHPNYNYKVVRREADGCELEFFEDGKSVGHMTWGKGDAEKAGLLRKNNWKNYPRDMYFARCLTSGARTFCPDVLGGSPVYTAEELGAEDAPAPVVPADVPPAEVPFTHDGGAAVTAAENVTDAEVVAEDVIGPSLLGYLRETFIASGKTDDELCWMLLSVGVQTLPGTPTKADIGKAMRELTIDQGHRLETLLKADEDVPGSGATT